MMSMGTQGLMLEKSDTKPPKPPKDENKKRLIVLSEVGLGTLDAEKDYTVRLTHASFEDLKQESYQASTTLNYVTDEQIRKLIQDELRGSFVPSEKYKHWHTDIVFIVAKGESDPKPETIEIAQAEFMERPRAAGMV